jgi:VWFA-related protein
MRVGFSWRLRLLVTCGLLFLAAASGDGRQQQPVFKSGVELVMVDVQVVDKKGTPIPALRADQFEVTIDGKKRAVVSAQIVDAATGVAESTAGAAEPSTAKPFEPGNVFVLAVDQGSFRAINAPSAMHAVREFIKRLGPNDYLGLVSFPGPGVSIDPTRDRAVVTAAVPKLVGFTALRQPRKSQFTLSDALDVASRDVDAKRRVVERNCPPNDLMCATEIEMEVNEVVTTLEAQAVMSLNGLRGAVEMVGSIPGRKTMVVLSAGIPSGDRTGGRVYMKTDALQAGKKAADLGILLYTLHLNTSFLDAFSPQAGSVSQTLMRETAVYARGLDTFNGTAGGTLLEVNTGPDFAIERVIRETSKYYLLGVEPQDVDRDGKPHMIKVKVSQGGSAVRNRPTVVIPKRAT